MSHFLQPASPGSRFRLSVRIAAVCAATWFGLVSNPAHAADFMYVSMGDNTIVRYDVSLATSALVQASASVFVPSGQGLNNPQGLAFDAAGNLYVANASGMTITRYDSSGTRIGTFFVPSGQGLSAPYGLGFDKSGNLYATNQGTDTITRYDSAGNRIGTDFVPAGQGLSDPFSLAFDKNGNLYAANYNSNTITRYDSSGNRIGTDFVPTGQGLSSPRGLAFDSAGYLYAVNGTNTVTRYDSAGTRIGTFFVPSGSGISNASGITFDSSGNLYVANTGGQSISKYDSAGVLQFTWSTGARQPRFLAFVPEPSTYVLGGLATAAMALIARRRKANRQA